MDFYTIDNDLHLELLGENKSANFIIFRYMLPFKLPLKPTDSFSFGDVMFVPLHREYKHYAMGDGFAHVPIKNTIIEATVKIPKSMKRAIMNEKERAKRKKKTKNLSKVFDKQLKYLNDFIEVIIMKYEFFNIYPVHMAELVGPSYYKIFQYNNRKLSTINFIGILFLDTEFKLYNDSYRILQDSEVKVIMDDFEAYKNHAYKRIVLSARKGERAFYLKDYDTTIIHYNTMFEVLIISIVRDYYELMNIKDIEKINNIINKSGLRNIINDHFYKIISKLKLEDYEEIKRATEKYLTEGYIYRNNIVHKAVSYKEEEASSVILNMKDLVYLLNFNIGKAEINNFVEHYNNHMANLNEILYEEVIDRYRK